MAKLPDHVKEIADKHNIPGNAFWDCHGTWVCKHHALEGAAARAGVKWQAPQILESESSKAVAVLATGSIGDYSEWSIGEASPKNNKNAYPWAMAEKRAKDRVILKLLGFAGDVYSEEEADEFKADKPSNTPPANDAPKRLSKQEARELYKTLAEGLRGQTSGQGLSAWGNKNAAAINTLPEDWGRGLREEYRAELLAFKANPEPEQESAHG